ncbi:transposase [Holospora obtusa]|uniref:transposase n=1 Tax=Holospora obtusa TaxID=49893 RepID=UPI00094ABFA3|nr:transposase [Holospora obtusa]
MIKELKPGQVVIMNNASFHNSQKIKEFLKFARCSFLPPYSPDLNLIEKFCSHMNRWIRQKVEFFQDVSVNYCFLFYRNSTAFDIAEEHQIGNTACIRHCPHLS